MAVTYNMKGTSHPSFAIGKSGPRIFTSSSDPSGSETVSNSDLWIDTTDYQLKIRVSGAWKQVGETVETLSASSLAITGDLTVSGTTTSINSTVLDVNDNKITLNSDYTADPTQDAGIVINRGTATDVELRWNETTDKWQFTEDGSTYITLRDPDLVNDTSPQLGGNLDTNGNNIVGGNGDKIELISDGTTPFIDVRGGSGPYIMRFRPGTSFTSTADGVDIKYRTTPNDLLIERSENNNKIAEFGGDDGHAALYYDDSIKIETTSDGITITGTLNTHTIPSGTGTIALTSDIAAAQTLSFSNNTLSISSGNSVTIDTLPTQTDHANKFLTTDGTDASWSYVLPEAGDVWGSIASSSDDNIDLGTITGDSSLWNGLDFGEIVEKISHSDLSVTTASASGSGSLSYDSSTGVFTFTPPVTGTYTVTESDVTTHQAALSITESQISDLQSYLTSVPAQTFSSLTGKPTTIAGYGITDAFDGAFGSLSGKPTTLAGYGITDGLQLGTSSTTALAGDTTIPSAVSQLSNDSAFITNSITTDFTLTNTDTGSDAGPIINLKRDSSSPANADYLGQIKFKGENSSGAEKNYAKITGKILDVTDGAEDGMIEYAFIKGGSQNISARFRGDALQLLNGTNLYIGSTGLIQFEGSSADAYETNLTVEEPTADRTVTIPDESGTVALTNSFTHFHSSAQTVTSGEATTNASGTVDYTFSELSGAIHYVAFLNRTLMRASEYSVSGTTLTVNSSVLATDDQIEVTGISV